MNIKKQRFALILLLASSMLMHLVYGIEGAAQMGAMERKLERQAVKLQDKQEQIDLLEVILEHQNEPQQQEEQEDNLIGEFEITYYTAGFESAGKNPGDEAYGITASGTTVKEGQTIAADWNVLPAGSTVYIEGVGERVVEDTGGLIKGNTIDVYVEDVEEALELGRHMANVYTIGEKSYD